MAPSPALTKVRKRKRSQHDKLDSSFDIPEAPSQRLIETEWWHDLVQRLSPSLKDLGTPGQDIDYFRSFFRVSRTTFDYICSLVRQDLVSRPPSGLINIEGRLLTVEKQVAIALRRLGSGDPQVSVGEQVGVGQSTVSQVTWRFVESMEERGKHHLKWPDAEELDTIKARFEQLGMPGCCGAIDITHMVMTLPAVESSADWYDREKNYSMALQVVVDPSLRFRDILTGWPGGMNELQLIRNCAFFRLCEGRQRLQGPPKQLSEGRQIREYIVGDLGYPLLPWLLTPYQEKDLAGAATNNFNRKQAAAVSIAETALARLKGTWRILHRVMWRPDKHKLPRIVLVCCLLHNIIIDQGNDVLPGVVLPDHHDKSYRQQICQYVDPQGQAMRDTLAGYMQEHK
ncbi:hypothetical protein GOP47_0003090 [Adiantum capillus-veneris]|uniref:DDE Tnp4 domain-containing protein n=1 Tax=Adiantum capillus-veneris TaxID=13818 RepID=A0A9D4ZRX7_ADICA|nr:hypothetical protein GOP47_0003090 [Adiantum capillus-veneris]